MAAEEQYADFDQLRVADYLIIIWKSRGFLFLFFTVAVLSALISSLAAPERFESTLTLMPPQQANPDSSMAALVGKLQGFDFGLFSSSLTSPQDILVSILESRTVAERIADKYHLFTYYKGLHDPREAVKALQDATTVAVSKAGIISVTVEDRDPRMAAELANAHGVELNKLLQQIDVTQGSQRRRFVTDRLAGTERRLKTAEEALMHFEEKNRAVSLPEQAQGVFNVTAQLRGQIMASEVELEMARNFATESNPQVLMLKDKVEELKKQLEQLQYGTGLDLPVIGGSKTGVGSTPHKEIYIAPANVPKLRLQYARLSREVKVQETVYTLLTQQLEEARIAETRDVVAAQVLDTAIPPLKRSRPRIALNMALAAALSVVLAVCFIFICEYLDNNKGGSQLTAN